MNGRFLGLLLSRRGWVPGPGSFQDPWSEMGKLRPSFTGKQVLEVQIPALAFAQLGWWQVGATKGNRKRFVLAEQIVFGTFSPKQCKLSRLFGSSMFPCACASTSKVSEQI